MPIKLGLILQKNSKIESKTKDQSELTLKKMEIHRRKKILVLDLVNI